MADTFTELRLQAEFLKLDSQRYSILSGLDSFKRNLESLSTDKPSLRSFTNLETAIKEESKNLRAIEKKIAAWFRSHDGKPIDSEFIQYKAESVKVLSDLEEAQNVYYDLLQTAGSLPVQVKPELSADVLAILKTMTDNQKATAAGLQAVSKTSKTRCIDQPHFDPSNSKSNPLALKKIGRNLQFFPRTAKVTLTDYHGCKLLAKAMPISLFPN